MGWINRVNRRLFVANDNENDDDGDINASANMIEYDGKIVCANGKK